jgi:hypothetical protein
MNYLIITSHGDPFYTNWYDYDNNYAPGMIVFNLLTCKHTHDGINWIDTTQDHL